MFTKELKNNPFTEVQKISGGNLYENYVRQDTQRNIDIQNLEDILDGSSSNDYLDWVWLFNYQADYFCNVVRVYTKDTIHQNLFNKVVRLAFFSGYSGLVKVNGIWTPVVWGRRVLDLEGKLTKGTTYQEAWNYDFSYSGSPEQFYENENPTVLKTGDDYIDYCFDNGISNWIKLLPFVKMQAKLLAIANNLGLTSQITLVVAGKNPTVLANTIRQWLDPTKPVKYQPFGENGLSDMNKVKLDLSMLESIRVEQKVAFMEFYSRWLNSYYQVIGRRDNNDREGNERNIAQEVAATQSVFDSMEWPHKVSTNNLVHEMNEKILDCELEIIDGDIEKDKKREEEEWNGNNMQIQQKKPSQGY